jgi:hypothetical protein
MSEQCFKHGKEPVLILSAATSVQCLFFVGGFGPQMCVLQVDCDVGRPKVNYRETIQRRAEFDYLHKKQSGGSGEADMWCNMLRSK